MSESRRVIITGTNKAGKSVVTEDVHAALTGPGNFDFWQTKPGQSPHDLSFGRSPMKFYPQPGGTMFRLFTIPARRSEHEVGRRRGPAGLVLRGGRRSGGARRYQPPSDDAHDSDDRLHRAAVGRDFAPAR